MGDYKINTVKYQGRDHTYQIVIEQKQVVIEDKNGDGKIGDKDTILEGKNDVAKKYRKEAQKIISIFRKTLSDELKKALSRFDGAEFIEPMRLPGQQGPLPSMRRKDDINAADLDSNGKTDSLSFRTSTDTFIEILLPCVSPCQCDPLDVKAVEDYLKVFDSPR